MQYKIAGIPIEINGIEYDYFTYRLKEYESAEEKSEIY